jgi:hypothetical protein
MGLAHGTRTGGGIGTEAVDAHAKHKMEGRWGEIMRRENPDMPEDALWEIAYAESQEESAKAGVLAGAITTALVGLFGFKGPEVLLRGGGEGLSGSAIKIIGTHGLWEAVEEGVDQGLQGVVSKTHYNPNLPWIAAEGPSVIGNAVHGSILGFGMGSFYSGVGKAHSTTSALIESGFQQRQRARAISLEEVKARFEDEATRAEMVEQAIELVLRSDRTLTPEEARARVEKTFNDTQAILNQALGEAQSQSLRVNLSLPRRRSWRGTRKGQEATLRRKGMI